MAKPLPMRKDEVIARLARKVEILERDRKAMRRDIRKAHQIMINIGGPLNDNVLQYSREQLVPFHRIDQLIAGWCR
jgi:hypothetical protein